VQVTRFGRYQLADLIGRGTTGKVYRAVNTQSTAANQVVAVKVLRAELTEDPEFLQQFRREMPTAADLTNPHVVPVHNYGEIGGQMYVEMPLIDGCNLGRLIRNEGERLLPARAVAIVEQVAAALDSAHREGLAHRNVKPSNILVAPPNDFTYLTDFGLARSADETAVGSLGHVPGAYMAPERFSGAGDSRSDIYSLACVLHKCLTGQQPFPGETLEEQRVGHLTAAPPRPSMFSPGIPPALNAVIAAGMAKSPEARYQTAPQLAAAAREALDGRFSPPPSPTSPPRSQATARPPRQQPGAAAQSDDGASPLALLAGLTVAGLALFGLIALVLVTATTSNNGVTATSSAPPTTTSAIKSTTTTTSSTPVARPALSQLPPFVPSAGLGANCEYPTSADAGNPATTPRTGQVATQPAPIDLDIVTNRGKIGLKLANNESPCTVRSFISLAQQKFFDGTHCHRLTTSPGLSVLQCGDPTGDGTGGPGYQFADEYPADQFPRGDPALKRPVRYPRGTLAMANVGPNTNGSQFFLVYRDSQLPPAYTVFGTIDATGLATLDKIAAAGVAGGGEDGPPGTPVTITSARLS
jgi:serine/threonine protein kinase